MITSQDKEKIVQGSIDMKGSQTADVIAAHGSEVESLHSKRKALSTKREEQVAIETQGLQF